SLAGALGIYYIGVTWVPFGLLSGLAKAAWAGVTVALVSAGLFFPVMMTFYQADWADYWKTGQHLDGLSNLKRIQRDEYEAIGFLTDNVKGTPVIMEAVTDSYHGGGRISSYTGLPTVLGWVTHEYYFRGAHQPYQGTRRDDVALAYQTSSPSVAAEIMKKYDVEYVIVGHQETYEYGAAGLSKFSSFMDPIYQNGEITIYKTRTDNGTTLPP
ncbi:MAG: hypothetical protein ACRD1T_05980, partial [Acidimicrobiia bacterium]